MEQNSRISQLDEAGCIETPSEVVTDQEDKTIQPGSFLSVFSISGGYGQWIRNSNRQVAALQNCPATQITVKE